MRDSDDGCGGAHGSGFTAGDLTASVHVRVRYFSHVIRSHVSILTRLAV